MTSVYYVSGDALNPVEVKGRKIICHIVNDIGVMGAGIALSIRKKWPIAYNKYSEGLGVLILSWERFNLLGLKKILL
jgi:hypothetical protein